MPRHAAELECSNEDRASLVALSRSGAAEARVVERARIILACLERKEIKQVARELKISIPVRFEVVPALLIMGLERLI